MAVPLAVLGRVGEEGLKYRWPVDRTVQEGEVGSLPPSGCWDPVTCPLLALKSGAGGCGETVCCARSLLWPPRRRPASLTDGGRCPGSKVRFSRSSGGCEARWTHTHTEGALKWPVYSIKAGSAGLVAGKFTSGKASLTIDAGEWRDVWHQRRILLGPHKEGHRHGGPAPLRPRLPVL